MGATLRARTVNVNTAAKEEPNWPELHRVRRAIVVIDIVESVRLMLQHEDEVIEQWRHFVHEVRETLLPAHGGSLAKSPGRGFALDG